MPAVDLYFGEFNVKEKHYLGPYQERLAFEEKYGAPPPEDLKKYWSYGGDVGCNEKGVEADFSYFYWISERNNATVEFMFEFIMSKIKNREEYQLIYDALAKLAKKDYLPGPDLFSPYYYFFKEEDLYDMERKLHDILANRSVNIFDKLTDKIKDAQHQFLNSEIDVDELEIQLSKFPLFRNDPKLLSLYRLYLISIGLQKMWDDVVEDEYYGSMVFRVTL